MSAPASPPWQATLPEGPGFWEIRDDRHGVHAFVRIVRAPCGHLVLCAPKGRRTRYPLARWSHPVFKWTRWRELPIPEAL